MIPRKNKRRYSAVLGLLVLVVCLLAGCDGKSGGAITSLSQLNERGRTIGIFSDTNDNKLVASKLPQAEVAYYQDTISGYTAVSQGKLDAFVYGKLAMETAIQNGMQGVRLLDETLGQSYTSAVALSPKAKIPDLENKVNAFLDEIKEDGTLDDIADRWLVRKEQTLPVIPVPETSPLHLVVGTSGSYEPFTYYVGTELRGYDIELAYRFGAWLGATVEFKVYDYGGIVAAAQSGDVDCVFAALFVTPERQEAIRFSQPTYIEEIAVMVRDTGSTAGDSAASNLAPQGDADWAGSEAEYQTFAELNGKTVSMLNGAPFEELIASKVPHVKEFTYYASMPDMMLAIKSKKSDAGFMNNAVATLAANRERELAVFPESLGETAFGIGLAKGDERLDGWQAAYDRISQEAKDALWKKWTGSDDSIKIMPEQDWPGKNGTVHVAACDSLEPMSYVGEGGEPLGLDIEMILLMAKELDVHVSITPMDFSAVLSALGSGKADLICGSIVVTNERKEMMDFVEYLPASYVLIVRSKETAGTGISFLDNIRSSFERTFLRENRWQLFLEGIGTTLLITVLSILFGTALGFCVFLLCRKGNPVANAITRFCVWLVQGMPMVVLLMILYYIIFGKVAISGTAVSVIGFTLVFGAAVYAMVSAGVATVDRGQAEAAYTLGYTDRKAFFRVVLPQALPHFMPAYKGEITALIKATAIVGYVAVQDLTKMGDIVRSRTYDAFFPLIAVAVIYFILAAILTFLVNQIELRIDPKRRTREDILKGVNVHD